MSKKDLADCIDNFFSDPNVQGLIDLARETRPLQICFPREVPISRFLAWIFDPSQGHGLQDAPIRRLLTAAWSNLDEKKIDLNIKRMLSPSSLFSSSFIGSVIQKEVKLESSDSLDILILLPREKVLIAIENKFGAGQGLNQLQRYSKALSEKYPEWQRVQIFLDLYGNAPNDDSWIGLDFEWLVDALKEAEKSPWLGDEPKRAIREFRRSIEIDGDPYSQFELDVAQLLEVVNEHRSVVEQMSIWQKSKLKLPDLVDSVFSSKTTIVEKAKQHLFPIYWQRLELWRKCIPMLSYAGIYSAAREKYPDILHDPHRKAFYFALEMWRGIESDDAVKWPLTVMVRFLPPNDIGENRFVVVSSLDIDNVDDEWKIKMLEFAKTLRANNLKKNRALKDDQGRMTLRADQTQSEAGTIKIFMEHLAMLEKAMVLVQS